MHGHPHCPRSPIHGAIRHNGLDRLSAIRFTFVPMKLADYMKLAGLRDQQFADLVGYERSLVCRWRNGIYLPRWDAIAAIARVTEGAVTAVDWIARAARKGDPSRDGSPGRRTVRRRSDEFDICSRRFLCWASAMQRVGYGAHPLPCSDGRHMERMTAAISISRFSFFALSHAAAAALGNKSVESLPPPRYSASASPDTKISGTGTGSVNILIFCMFSRQSPTRFSLPGGCAESFVTLARGVQITSHVTRP